MHHHLATRRRARARALGPFVAASIAVVFAVAGAAAASEPLSTSALHPTPVGPSGVVQGPFPDGGKTTYYLSLDVTGGDLLTQVEFSGRPGAEKSVELAVLDDGARTRDSVWTHGSAPGEQATRRFPIDRAGRQILKLEVDGPATATFRVELGGTAGATLAPKPPAAPGTLSSSVFSPTAIPPDGIVSGPLPGVDRAATYYVLADLQKGDLLTQLTLVGREGPMKSIDFGLLEPNARTGGKYWLNDNGASGEKTRSFPIDRDGPQIIRIATTGPETGTFKVELGGTAMAARAGAAGKIAQASGGSPLGSR